MLSAFLTYIKLLDRITFRPSGWRNICVFDLFDREKNIRVQHGYNSAAAPPERWRGCTAHHVWVRSYKGFMIHSVLAKYALYYDVSRNWKQVCGKHIYPQYVIWSMPLSAAPGYTGPVPIPSQCTPKLFTTTTQQKYVLVFCGSAGHLIY